MSVLDHPAVCERIFHPRSSGHDPNLTVPVGDAVLGCYLRTPHPAAGLVLHFHGNGELSAEYDAGGHADFFADMGVNVCFAEYRGYGRSTGTPQLAAMLGDGEAVLKATGFPPERVVAFGRSTGSIYAVELAHRVPTLAGVVLESGIADVQEQWDIVGRLAGAGVPHRDAEAALAASFDQRAKLAAYRGPVLVLHAAHDRLVPPTHADRLHAWAGGAGKRLVVYPLGHHNSILIANHAEYVRDATAFFQQAGIASPPRRADP